MMLPITRGTLMAKVVLIPAIRLLELESTTRTQKFYTNFVNFMEAT